MRFLLFNFVILTKFPVRFHIAHLYEVQSKHKAAKVAYEQLLNEKQLTPQLKADIYRQIGKHFTSITFLSLYIKLKIEQ